MGIGRVRAIDDVCACVRAIETKKSSVHCVQAPSGDEVSQILLAPHTGLARRSSLRCGRAAAAMNPEEVRAGALVGAGALLAGPLYKRSAWKREYRSSNQVSGLGYLPRWLSRRTR